jgi:dynein intermediate chain 1, axonemal
VPKEDPGLMKESVQSDDNNILHATDMATAAKVLERMVNQNTYNDIAMDFKFWDDASDQFKTHEGTLLPLWKFTNERARKKAVTSIAWNPQVQAPTTNYRAYSCWCTHLYGKHPIPCAV